MKKLLIFVALAAAVGCKTPEMVALKYYSDNPGKLAAICATNYPVRDSVGKAEVLPSNNIDHTQEIDSLGQLVNNLKGQLEVDASKIAAGGQISAQEVAKYKTQVSTLQKAMSDLRGSYVRCKPDTIKVPIYRESTARVAALQATLQGITSQLDKTQTNLDNITEDRNRWRLIVIGIAAVLVVFFLGRLIYFKYFKK